MKIVWQAFWLGSFWLAACSDGGGSDAEAGGATSGGGGDDGGTQDGGVGASSTGGVPEGGSAELPAGGGAGMAGTSGTTGDGGADAGVGGGSAGAAGGSAGEGGSSFEEPAFSRVQVTAGCLAEHDSPDDGVDSDLQGGDYTLTDANAVFVALPGDGGSDAQAGTHASPLATLAAAVTLAKSSNKAVAVGRGTFIPADLRGVFVYGGYNPADWSRDVAANVTKIEVSAPLVVGGDLQTNESGGIDGITVSGTSSSSLVHDVGEANEIENPNPIDSRVVGCILDCSSCGGAVIDLNLPHAIILNSAVTGGTEGIHAAPPGGLGRYTGITVCGNQVAGASSNYSRGIQVGAGARGNVAISWNDVSVANDSSVGIQVDMPNTLYSALDDNLEAATITHNLVLGRGATGISSATGGVVAVNLVQLTTAGSTGLSADVGAPTAPLPFSFLGNAVSVRGTALALVNLGTDVGNPTGGVVIAGNSLRGSGGVSMMVGDGGNVQLLDNLIDASATGIDINVDLTSPAVVVRNNDILGATALLSVQPPFGGAPVAVTSASAVNACGWDSCSAASGNISAAPLYDPVGDLRVLASSPCVNAGIDPTVAAGAHAALLTPDINGDSRPSGVAWDIGSDEVP